MHVIGTAGHVDHGKSTLVKALTGIHPDRLKEEQEREMTIDLGFAWLKMPDGSEIGIVDVPGHRDFIENMLAGVGGIDAALLVIAADEGVMPQTREHLAILDLLSITSCIIVMTKIDLVDDPDWLDLVELEIHEVLQGTKYMDAPFVRVSAQSGEGIPDLVRLLSIKLSETQTRVDLGRPRLPIDRVFSISGFGTVVTGTLLDGSLRIGDDVEILPEGFKARVRGLQTHKEKELIAQPGSRTAVNLSGIDHIQVRRGCVLTGAGKYLPTQRIDGKVKILPGAELSLKHNMEVKFFLGATEELARVRVLGTDQLSPGQEGWIQLEIKGPVVAVRNDRFILRIPSPGETIGGGIVVNPQPGRRHKRFQSQIIQQLEAYLHGNPEEIFLQACLDLGVCEFSDIIKKSRLEIVSIRGFLPGLIESGLIIQLEPGDPFQKSNLRFCSISWYKNLLNQMSILVQNYHEQYPLRGGIPRSELRSKLKIDQKTFNLLLSLKEPQDLFAFSEQLVSRSGFNVVLSLAQEGLVSQLIRRFEAAPFSTPAVKECQQFLGEEVWQAVLQKRIFMQVSADVAFLTTTYKQTIKITLEQIEINGSITVSNFRDLFATSRKYALAFLEHLDQLGITLREGDERKAGKTKLDVDRDM
ncbi:MAG: selenocysteine-specific translation elongation factor [Chloroflexi bacterium HGW-Chloroflexi-10]|nr:MAG: selenocysteine-specific translation elongation factor [Chloroflexi bacterium HGW-Chloroflexi-10]